MTIIDMTFHNLGEVIFDVLLYFIRSRYRCVGLSIMYQTETYIAWLKIASARHDFVVKFRTAVAFCWSHSIVYDVPTFLHLSVCSAANNCRVLLCVQYFKYD